jgi:tetratricopeptide (TPR) repeat protein
MSDEEKSTFLSFIEEDKERVLHRVSTKDLPKDTPTLSLHMIVKNGQSVIARTLNHVLPYLSQVRIVLNDTEDRTREVIAETMKARPEVEYDVQDITSASHPYLYIIDTPETYKGAGPSLSGEEFQGPFTEQPLLIDWSSVRNAGWESKAAYRLQMDADDLLTAPETLPLALKAMEEVGADLAAAPYHINNSMRTVFRERLARTTPVIRWEGFVHDRLVGGLRRMLFEDLLYTVDMRDSKATGTRVVGRDFKALYFLARRAEWQVSLRHYLYLLQEARYLMPLEWVVGPLLERYRQEFEIHGVPSRLPEKAWVYTMVGELFEEKNDCAKALEWYEKALTADPTRNGYWRRCRAEYQLGHYTLCEEAYLAGHKCLVISSVLDVKPIPEPAIQVLVASAISELGRHGEAIAMLDKVLENGKYALPGVVALKQSIMDKQL